MALKIDHLFESSDSDGDIEIGFGAEPLAHNVARDIKKQSSRGRENCPRGYQIEAPS